MAIFTLLVLLALSGQHPAATDAAASPTIQGLWLSEKEDAGVRVEPCGAELCGSIIWLAEPLDDGSVKLDVNNPDESLRSREVIGLRILEGFPVNPDKKQAWKGGQVYDPENGKTYRCTLTLEDPGRMKLRGFIGISLLGRTTYWRRVGEERFLD